MPRSLLRFNKLTFIKQKVLSKLLRNCDKYTVLATCARLRKLTSYLPDGKEPDICLVLCYSMHGWELNSQSPTLFNDFRCNGRVRNRRKYISTTGAENSASVQTWYCPRARGMPLERQRISYCLDQKHRPAQAYYMSQLSHLQRPMSVS